MLSRRWIINYVLIVLICLFTYVGNRFDVQTGFQNDNRVESPSAAEIDLFEIQTANETLRLTRNGSDWWIATPIRWPANNINVKRILDITNAKTDSRLPANEIDLAEFGLQFPRALMRLNDTEVVFGITNNIGERRYTMIGSTVYLLPDIYLPFIVEGLVAVVDRRLIPASLPLASLRLPDFEINRGADSNWQVADSERFSDAQLTQLIENWQGLQASRIKAFNSSATPRQKLLAQLENGGSHEFFLMTIEPEIIIAHPQIGLQYHFSNDHYYQLISLREN